MTRHEFDESISTERSSSRDDLESSSDDRDATSGDQPSSDDHPSIQERSIDWEKAQEGARLLLESIGEDPDREGLVDTWQRRVPATIETLSAGTRDADKPEMRTFDATGDDLVVKTGIPFYSLCEHHLLPFYGTAHVAYRPNGAVVGLSKLIRYVRWQSRRPTIQEGLTRSIATGLADEIDADGVVVELSGTHLCEAMRGVETETRTVTRASVGELSDGDRRRFADAITRSTRTA